MNDIKGFLVIPQLSDNRDGYTAKFGELSEVSETFTRDRRRFDNAGIAPNVFLQTFRYVDGSGTSVNPAATAVTNRILVLGQWLFNQYDTAQVPNNLQASLFASSIQTEFEFIDVTVGPITEGSSSSKRLPSYVRFKMKEGGIDYQVKLWIQDEKFRQEFEHYKVYVIPPTQSLSDLRLNFVGLTNVLTTQNITGHIVDNISSITSKYPATAITKYELQWFDLSDPEVFTTTTWTIVSYGLAGTDEDAIKEEIRNYIATNSNEGQWNVIYPSLYSENEFAIVPLWDQMAAPESGASPVLFSPTCTPAKAQSVASTKLPSGYGQSSASLSAYVSRNLRVCPSSYREVALLIIGNPNNSGNINDILTLFPDYTGISSTHADFSRMAENTRNFITELHGALDIAYTADLNTIFPAGFARTIRTNRLYVSFALGGYSFMVQTRASYNQ